MSGLWWAANGYELPTPAGDIGAVKEGLGSALVDNGYQDVAVNSDVQGFKPGIDFFAAILFLYIGGQNFWQVVAVGGDGTEAQAQAEIANIEGIINGLEFL